MRVQANQASQLTQATQRVALSVPQGSAWGNDHGLYDPAYTAAFAKRMAWIFGRYFRMDVQGMEQLPDEPSLLVSNHSGGMLLLDVMGMLVAFQQAHGGKRDLHTLFHDCLMRFGLTGRPLSKLGGLKANRHNAIHALRELQRDVLVYPGGDVDAYRPYSQRHQVNFDGRKGYVRLALETGAPITPVAHRGAHETLMVLTTGQRIARFLRLDKWMRAKVFPVYLCFPWILSPGPILPHFPLPRTFHYRVAAPIEMPKRTWQGKAPEAIVDMVDEKVRQEIQAMMTVLSEEKPMRRALPLQVERMAKLSTFS